MKHKHYDVLLAIAEGKEVECKLVDGWSEPSVNWNPISDTRLEWRIKPDMDDVITEKFNSFSKGIVLHNHLKTYRAAFLSGVQACQNGEYY